MTSPEQSPQAYRPEMRSEPRVEVYFHGTLALGGVTTPCSVKNMCSRGFLIKYSKDLPVGSIGQHLHFTCELYPGRIVKCTVQVRHINREYLGAKVMEMNEEGQAICQQFLAERRAAEQQAAARS